MNKTLKIVTSILVGAVIIGGIAFFALKDNGGSGDKSVTETVKKLESDDLSPEDLEKKMIDLGYEVYPNSTDENKYAYNKLEGEDTEYIFVKDYNKKDVQSLFVMYKTVDGSKFTFSTTNLDGEKQTLLIEKQVTKDCSKEKCVTSSEKESTIQQYTYDLDNGDFKAVSEYENPVKLGDIQSDLDVFKKELNSIYN